MQEGQQGSWVQVKAQVKGPRRKAGTHGVLRRGNLVSDGLGDGRERLGSKMAGTRGPGKGVPRCWKVTKDSKWRCAAECGIGEPGVA